MSTNSLPSIYLIYPCFVNFLRNTSEMAEQRTIDLGSSCLAILLIFWNSNVSNGTLDDTLSTEKGPGGRADVPYLNPGDRFY